MTDKEFQSCFLLDTVIHIRRNDGLRLTRALKLIFVPAAASWQINLTGLPGGRKRSPI
jgi:hypothetical protein